MWLQEFKGRRGRGRGSQGHFSSASRRGTGRRKGAMEQGHTGGLEHDVNTQMPGSARVKYQSYVMSCAAVGRVVAGLESRHVGFRPVFGVPSPLLGECRMARGTLYGTFTWNPGPVQSSRGSTGCPYRSLSQRPTQPPAPCATSLPPGTSSTATRAGSRPTCCRNRPIPTSWTR